jgi:hypothetical protein
MDIKSYQIDGLFEVTNEIGKLTNALTRSLTRGRSN